MKEGLARVNSYHGGSPFLGGSVTSGVDMNSGVPIMISCEHREGTRPSPTTWAWRPNYMNYAQVLRGDPREPVSSLLSAMVGKRPDLSLSPVCPVPDTQSESMGPMGMTTIAAHGGSPQGGRRSIRSGKRHPEYFRGGAKN
jgi:hypothetical protein